MDAPAAPLPRLLAIGLAALALTADAPAQRGAEGPRARRLPVPQSNLSPTPAAVGRSDLGPGGAARPAILLTGYWPPTNEMLRRFSRKPGQNPKGWIGANWEGRGYDVYAFFPEFPAGSGGKGDGDLEVDYQDTSADFWPISHGVAAIAVITFSRGFPDLSWELEMNQYNYASWVPDYLPPTQPTPAPPDSSLPAGSKRLSTLPVQAVVDAVDRANLGLSPLICWSGNGGGFLSEFIAYHGVWYQDRHKDPLDPGWCLAAGHVHVGGLISKALARRAAYATVRTVIHHADAVLDPDCQRVRPYCRTAQNSAGPGAQLTTTGPASVSANALRLIVTDGVPYGFGLLLYGGAPGSQPLGDGTLCIAGALQRILPAAPADATGLVDLALDFTQPPLSGGAGQVTPGSTWYFQYWYRDTAAGGAGHNLSTAVEITFCP